MGGGREGVIPLPFPTEIGIHLTHICPREAVWGGVYSTFIQIKLHKKQNIEPDFLNHILLQLYFYVGKCFICTEKFFFVSFPPPKHTYMHVENALPPIYSLSGLWLGIYGLNPSTQRPLNPTCPISNPIDYITFLFIF